MLHKWLKSRHSRVITGSPGTYKRSVSFNQLTVLFSIFNPNLPYQMGMVFMEIPTSQQIHLNSVRFSTLFPKISFFFFFSLIFVCSFLSPQNPKHNAFSSSSSNIFFLSLPSTPLSSQLTLLSLSWPISIQIHFSCIPSPKFFLFSGIHTQ